MDDFLKETYAVIFWKYIKNYKYKDNMHVEVTDEYVKVKTDYSYSQMTCYDEKIFEFQVVNTYTQENEFYLHFQMKNLKHARDLFYEMIRVIESLVNKPQTRVLLTCSGGLTTGFFASKLNDSAKLLQKDYSFDAVAFDDLISHAKNYDIILLAPQISYQHAKLQQQFPSKIVMKIPSRVFAKYDTGTMLSIIEETQIKQYKKEHEVLSLCEVTHHHGEVLTLILIRNSSRIHIGYRLFGKDNDILEDGEIIKTFITLEDIFDVIDTMMVKHKHIDAVSIATPGVINNGVVDTMKLEGMIDGTNIAEEFKKHYHQKLVLCNDVNSVAVGYHACQNLYHNISVIFQPISTNAGIGHIINDQLHVGYHSLSGEVQYLPLVLSKSRFELNKTIEGTIELLTQMLLSCIVSVAPELIVICNVLVDIERLKEELQKYIPHIYLPKIVRIEYLQDYSFIGCLMLATRELYNDDKYRVI